MVSLVPIGVRKFGNNAYALPPDLVAALNQASQAQQPPQQ